MVSTAAGRKVAPGHAAIEVLKANGVEVVFGLNGDHVLRLYDGLADLGGIEHVTVKHENNASLAARARPGASGPPKPASANTGTARSRGSARMPRQRCRSPARRYPPR